MTYYTITRRAQGGGKPKYSIDQVDPAGKFICQTAFWFDSFSSARTRLAEIIAKDNAASHTPMAAEWQP